MYKYGVACGDGLDRAGGRKGRSYGRDGIWTHRREAERFPLRGELIHRKRFPFPCVGKAGDGAQTQAVGEISRRHTRDGIPACVRRCAPEYL